MIGDAIMILTERIEHRILLIRARKVMLDVDLAELYEVTPKALNQAVRRNRSRFPDDFLFRLTWEEVERSRSQFVTLNGNSRPARENQDRRVSVARGHNIKFRPFAFTEQGVAMLSGVLRSKRAVLVNIEIMRAFMRLRSILGAHADLARRLNELEGRYDAQFKVVFDAIRDMMEPGPVTRRQIGLRPD
jgi:hypothetical protein